MTVRKVGRMWSSGVGEFMDSGLGRALQIVLVALGIAGLVAARIPPALVGTLCLAAPIVSSRGRRRQPRRPAPQ